MISKQQLLASIYVCVYIYTHAIIFENTHHDFDLRTNTPIQGTSTMPLSLPRYRVSHTQLEHSSNTQANSTSPRRLSLRHARHRGRVVAYTKAFDIAPSLQHPVGSSYLINRFIVLRYFSPFFRTNHTSHYVGLCLNVERTQPESSNCCRGTSGRAMSSLSRRPSYNSRRCWPLRKQKSLRFFLFSLGRSCQPAENDSTRNSFVVHLSEARCLGPPVLRQRELCLLDSNCAFQLFSRRTFHFVDPLALESG